MDKKIKRLAAAREVKYRIDQVILRANFQDSAEARVSASLCLTIAEQYAAAIYLISGGFSSHAPIIVRSMLEGLANLLNLVSDAGYLDQMRFENARSDVILFEEYARDPDMQDDQQAIQTLAALRDQAIPVRDELAARRFTKQDLPTKFKQAKIQQHYVAYRVFCSFAHNQLTTLLSRHAVRFDLKYHNEAPEEMTEGLLSIAVYILYRAVATFPTFSNVPEGELKQVLDEIDALWIDATEN